MRIKIALPKGRLQDGTAALLQKADWGLEEYNGQTRLYRPRSQRLPDLQFKVFHEKDIPIQVAVGNYDLGICGRDWVDELLAKYPSSAVVKVKDLGYGESALFMAAGSSGTVPDIEKIKARPGLIRIVSEYPNLAESFALRNRLGRFCIFPVWGGAEVYPPESADLALISVKTEAELASCGMTAVGKVLDSSAFVIANRDSWKSKDLGEIISSLENVPVARPSAEKSKAERTLSVRKKVAAKNGLARTADVVRLALPDGHQQLPTVELLNKAGITLTDYPSITGNRRPIINLKGVTVKVVRPQDMPLQVANGNFDLAITGRDWLLEHLYQFPSSPVKELLDLRFGMVKIVAVVGQSVDDVAGLRRLVVERPVPLRVASEYVNIADRYARENHLGPYRVVPTWGATEAFLPDDADLLVENTQTGRTIASHGLKIISTLFESTACLIGNVNNTTASSRAERIAHIIETLRCALEDTNCESD